MKRIDESLRVSDLLENMPIDLRESLIKSSPRHHCGACRDRGVIPDSTASDQVKDYSGHFCHCREGRIRWLKTQRLVIPFYEWDGPDRPRLK